MCEFRLTVEVACEGVPLYPRYRLSALVIGLCLLAWSCGSVPDGSTETSSEAPDPCGPIPTNFTEVPEPVPGQSERLRELNEENLREWQDQLLVPLDETMARLGSVLVNAGTIGDPIEAWDVLWVFASLDPPIPLRILDQVIPLLPAEVVLGAYAELDDGYTLQFSGSSPQELAERFDGMLLTFTTTTVVPGRSGTPAIPDRTELAVLVETEKDLRLVVPAYAIPVSLLRETGYDALPLRELVSGVQISPSRHPTGMGKPSDELFTASAGWRFCQDVAEALKP